jgi:hypothetical protein
MRVVVFTLAALALAGTTAEGAQPPRSGLHGIVMRGPTRPVCLESQSCTAPAAGIVLQFWRAGDVAARAKTGPVGGYVVKLRAGTYVVKTGQVARIGSGLTPRLVRVPSGRVARVNFLLDTGIQ